MAKKTDEERNEYERKRRKVILEWMKSAFAREVQTATGEVISMGRPPTVKTAKDLYREATAYIDDINRRNDDDIYIIPDVESFCCWLGIDRNTLWMWSKSKDPAFCEVLKFVLNYIASVKKQLLLKGDIPALPGLADLNNNHGYTNAPQVVRHEVVAELPTVDEIARRLPKTE